MWPEFPFRVKPSHWRQSGAEFWCDWVMWVQSKYVDVFNIEVKSTGCEHTCLKSFVAARSFVKSDEIILMSSGFSQLWLGDYTFTTDSLWYKLWLCVYQWKSSVCTFCGARDHRIQISLLLIPLTHFESPHAEKCYINKIALPCLAFNVSLS